MATRSNRRPSFLSSTSSSLAKHSASQINYNSNPKPNVKVVKATSNHRQPLRNLTNINTSRSTTSSSSFNLLPCSTKSVKPKQRSSISNNSNSRTAKNGLRSLSSTTMTTAPLPVPSSSTIRVSAISTPSDGSVILMDESSSFFHSFSSPELRYMDAETNDEFLDMDRDSLDLQLCATNAFDIYNHLRASEVKKRPSTNYMEQIQKDINASMRSILIDWLVEAICLYCSRNKRGTLHLFQVST